MTMVEPQDDRPTPSGPNQYSRERREPGRTRPQDAGQDEGCSGRFAQANHHIDSSISNEHSPAQQEPAPEEVNDGILRSLADLGRELLGSKRDIDDSREVLTYRLLHLSDKDYGDVSGAHTDDGGHPKQWDTTPVEQEIFERYTVCFGLFFNSFR